MTKIEAIRNYKEQATYRQTLINLSDERVENERIRRDQQTAINGQFEERVAQIADDAELSIAELREAVAQWNGMTEAQRRAVEDIEREVLNDVYRQNEGRDGSYKRLAIFDFTPSDYTDKVYVYVEVGEVGDESNIMFAFREQRHIAVGRRGGLMLINAARFIDRGDGVRKVKAANVKGPRALWAPTYNSYDHRRNGD